jgi:hypothetical protein
VRPRAVDVSLCCGDLCGAFSISNMLVLLAVTLAAAQAAFMINNVPYHRQITKYVH